MQISLNVDNDILVELNGLFDELEEIYINDATVEVTLYNADDGTQVDGPAWPMTMTYKVGSNGIYQTTLPASTEIEEGALYELEIEATLLSGGRGLWKEYAIARIRRS